MVHTLELVTLIILLMLDVVQQVDDQVIVRKMEVAKVRILIVLIAFLLAMVALQQ